MRERRLLRDMFDAAIAAASPAKAVPANLPPPPEGRTVVVSAGKAAAAQRRVLGDEIAGAAQDQRPGQFDRRRRGVAGMNDLHPVPFTRSDLV